MEQQTYTIREMSERFGLPASTLRYYEEIGLLTDVIHTESKKRIYTQQHINCMTAILWVSHFQSFKQNVQWGLVILIIFFDLSASKHFHDHRKVLFFRWSLMQQIQHKCL